MTERKIQNFPLPNTWVSFSCSSHSIDRLCCWVLKFFFLGLEKQIFNVQFSLEKLIHSTTITINFNLMFLVASLNLWCHLLLICQWEMKFKAKQLAIGSMNNLWFLGNHFESAGLALMLVSLNRLIYYLIQSNPFLSLFRFLSNLINDKHTQRMSFSDSINLIKAANADMNEKVSSANNTSFVCNSIASVCRNKFEYVFSSTANNALSIHLIHLHIFTSRKRVRLANWGWQIEEVYRFSQQFFCLNKHSKEDIPSRIKCHWARIGKQTWA